MTRLERIMEKRGVTRVDLARRAGISEQILDSIIDGDIAVTGEVAKNLERLAQAPRAKSRVNVFVD
jgi:plasmid maintenance system antidote protein VapI